MKYFSHLILILTATTALHAAGKPIPAPAADKSKYQEDKIQDITSLLTLNQKEVDPFGLSPRGPIIKAAVETATPTDEPKPEVIDVETAVEHIQIQAIDDQHHLALDQTTGRDIQEGDLIVLNYKDKLFKVWVNKIRPDEITFTEYGTGQRETLHIDFVEQAPSMIDESPNTLNNIPGVSND